MHVASLRHLVKSLAKPCLAHTHTPTSNLLEHTGTHTHALNLPPPSLSHSLSLSRPLSLSLSLSHALSLSLSLSHSSSLSLSLSLSQGPKNCFSAEVYQLHWKPMALEDRTLDLPFSGAARNERMYQDKTLPTKLKRRSHSPPSQELSPYMAMQLRTPAWLT